MPPAPPDPLVGRASGPVGAVRRIRPRRERDSLRGPAPASVASETAPISTKSALEALLVDLGSQVRRGVSQETAEALQALATGLPELDAQLGGGLPCGRLSEICGPPSSGRTALSFRLLAETLRRGVLAAWVDLADAFDPTSAAESGVDLDRLLWVRPRRIEEAVRSTERLLQTEGFELVVFDLSHGLPGEIPTPIRDVTWLRFARLAASTRTALVILSRDSRTGSRSELVLEMQALGARFASPPDLLETLETTVVLQRHRTRPAGARVSLSISALDFRSDSRSDLQTDQT